MAVMAFGRSAFSVARFPFLSTSKRTRILATMWCVEPGRQHFVACGDAAPSAMIGDAYKPIQLQSRMCDFKKYLLMISREYGNIFP